MKLRLKDLQLAMDYMQHNSNVEYVELDTNEYGGAATSLSFVDKNAKTCKIFLYDSAKGVTPELRVTQRLYKKES
jgi:hypothetical protein